MPDKNLRDRVLQELSAGRLTFQALVDRVKGDASQLREALAELGRENIVRAQRGRSGGFELVAREERRAAIQDSDAAFLEQLSRVGQISNRALRELLQLSEDEYLAVRERLKQKGKIELGRGRGGVVRLKGNQPTQVIESREPETLRERTYYESIKSYLSVTWAPYEFGSDPNVMVEVIANGGRRSTGGLWSRPDLVAVAVETFDIVPGKHLSVFSFEVKLQEYAVIGVYEAAAHQRQAHYSTLVVISEDEWLLSDEGQRAKSECSRLGVGLCLFSDTTNQGTMVIDPQLTNPDNADLDSLLQQTSEPLQRWLRARV